MNFEQALQKLTVLGQTHLLSGFENLTENEKEHLLNQIENLSFEGLSVLNAEPGEEKAPVYEPLVALTVEEIDENRAEYEKIGLETIRAGKTAAVLLAGGQGTRLGSDHAKGLYDIGVTKPLYIFQCLVNNLKAVTDKAGAFIPLYVMTSEINNRETVAFFKEHDYFGYNPGYIRFFVQDMAVCTDFDGKVLLNGKGSIASSPNGNGGWFHSLKKAGFLDELKKNGVEYLSAFAVDNVLQKINDPAFVGATVKTGVDVGAMVVRKADPLEKVGVICKKNGRPSIVEYYEMTDEMTSLRDEEGRLLYNYGVILNYLYKLSKLEELDNGKMAPHIVKKKIPFMAEDGTLVSPEEPNGYKYELLILDQVEMTDSCLPFEVLREDAFAPIKNPTGVDSVESAREYLRKKGVEL